MKDFYYFIDFDFISLQILGIQFGKREIIVGNDVFRIIDFYIGSINLKVYVICGGEICVQQDLVNFDLIYLILKLDQMLIFNC